VSSIGDRMGDEPLDDARRNPLDAVGLAPVVAESDLVEVGLQVLGNDRARMRAQKPALQEQDCPVADLQRIALAPLRLRLDDPLAGRSPSAVAVVAARPIGHDPRVGRNLAFGEALDRGLIALCALEWGERVRSRGGRGQLGQVMPPAWSNTRSR
jgi:hypothetical protein